MRIHITPSCISRTGTLVTKVLRNDFNIASVVAALRQIRAPSGQWDAEFG